MTNVAIWGIATAVPPHQHTQTDLHDRWLSPYINSHRSRAIFTAAEIDTRYSVLPTSEFLAGEPGTQARNELYLKAARPLAMQAIQQVLAQTGLTPSDIEHFIIISCTGLDTPGLDAGLAADLDMQPRLRRSALIGMGCHAGLTGLDRALQELAVRPGSRVLILAIEFGTIHFQHGSKIDDMIAGAIFGDGLAAAIVGPALPPNGYPRIIDTLSYSDYSYHDLMGVRLTNKGFQIHLSTRVSKVLPQIVPKLAADFLAQSGLSFTDIKFWGIHPGGARILDNLAQALELEPQALRFSRKVLRRYGNMSSATIFFVLAEIMQQGQPRPGDYALLLSFGPGLTIELCLLQW